MLKTLWTALSLLWLSATTLDNKVRLAGSYIFGLMQGIIAFASPLALSEMIKQISNNNVSGALFWFYAMVVLAAALIISRYIWRYSCEQITRILPLNLRQIYYGKIFNKSYEWHLHNSVGYFQPPYLMFVHYCRTGYGFFPMIIWVMPLPFSAF